MPTVKRLLWWMMAGSSGGLNRARIIHLLNERPYNTNQIAKELGLDYKTVAHHLNTLLKNRLVSAEGDGYGKMYFISEMLEENWAIFEKIWEEIGKTNKKS